MNKEQVVILVENVVDFKAKKFKIGGVQTYVQDLATLFIKQGIKVSIIESHQSDLVFNINDLNIYGVRKRVNFFRQKNHFLLLKAKQITSKNDIIIISTDQMGIRSKDRNVIAIQHGIAFDFPKSNVSNAILKNNLLFGINKLLRCLKNIGRFKNVRNTVCVDYNFFNWYRTLADIPGNHITKVIPNYTSKIKSKEEIELKLLRRSPRKILFARRFVDYRGTILFANVVESLLSIYDDLEVSFAGDGPLKSFLEDKFKNEDRVSIFSFTPVESVNVHYKYDIAVVPTVFSEGTSLSLCEASGSGCFPIATHVGGMTNMIIDGYNGRLVYPSETDMLITLKEVIEMPDIDFNNIVLNSWNVAQSSFSIKKWEKKWLEYIQLVKCNLS